MIMNLGNVLDAAAGEAAFSSDLGEAARQEARLVLKAAAVALSDAGGADDERRKQLMQMQPVPGADRVGSSSAQSLARGTGSIETDYLNGEIALLGRLNGVPTPINDGLVRLGRHLIAQKSKPGSLSLDEVTAIVRS
jgi:2-dehydropantoate 2-reductase